MWSEGWRDWWHCCANVKLGTSRWCRVCNVAARWHRCRCRLYIGRWPDPWNHIIYIVPTGDDSTPQGFASVLQPTVEPLPVTDSEYVADNNSTRSMSDITNTSCLYLGPVPDSCDISCSVGPRPVQYSECSAVISANEHYGDNMTTNCMVNELGCFQSNEGRSNVISNIDGFIHSVDSSLESFSLSVLTDAVNS